MITRKPNKQPSTSAKPAGNKKELSPKSCGIAREIQETRKRFTLSSEAKPATKQNQTTIGEADNDRRTQDRMISSS